MPERKQWTVEQEVRLDQALAANLGGMDRVAVRGLIQQGKILVNGQMARKAGQYVQPGDVIDAPGIDFPVEELEAVDEGMLSALGMSLEYRYEDESLIVLEKPAGMALHPTKGYPAETVSSLVTARYPEIENVGGLQHAGMVQRLEPEISGLLVVARTEEAYRAIQRVMRRQQVETAYLGLVEGELTGQGVIEESIGNVGRSRLQLAVTRQGRPALTAYKVLRHYKEDRREYTLVEVRPQSARMHQIRVHLSWWGYPLVGDRLYGSRIQSLVTDRIFLHLSILSFAHPVTGEMLRWESSLPPDLRTITHYLNRPKRA